MTRQRVHPDQRQRTAHACESCRRRKQKCNGGCPCEACIRRHFDCKYEGRDRSPPSPTPARSQSTHFSLDSIDEQINASSDESVSSQSSKSAFSKSFKLAVDFRSPPATHNAGASIYAGAENLEFENHLAFRTKIVNDRQYGTTYLGMSANGSLHDLVQMLLKHLVGHQPRPQPHQHQYNDVEAVSIKENAIEAQNVYPRKDVAHLLAEVFFKTSAGMIEIFDERNFMSKMEKSYQKSQAVNLPWLCHLYLVLAVGSSSMSSSTEHLVTAHGHDTYGNAMDQSKSYYLAAKRIFQTQVEVGNNDLWSIQAMALMSWWMLCRCQRHEAYKLVERATCSAQMIGLHRPETLAHFDPTEQDARINIWRTLFVLNTFMSDCLGLSTAMAEGNLSGAMPDETGGPRAIFDVASALRTRTGALDTVMVSADTLRDILSKMYTSDKFGSQAVRESAMQCEVWQGQLPTLPLGELLPNTDDPRSFATLHTNLMHCEALMLLGMPMLLLSVVRQIYYPDGSTEQHSDHWHEMISEYATMCLRACNHVIAMAKTTLIEGRMPRNNPLVIHTTFRAALVTFIHELIRPSSDGKARVVIDVALQVLEYCGQTNPQARQCFCAIRKLEAETVQYRKAQIVTSSIYSEYQPFFGVSNGAHVPFFNSSSAYATGSDHSSVLIGDDISPLHSYNIGVHDVHFPVQDLNTTTGSFAFSPEGTQFLDSEYPEGFAASSGLTNMFVGPYS